jgi:hypothetical protein
VTPVSVGVPLAPQRAHRTVYSTAPAALLLALFGVYALQLRTPLRITEDSISYLSLAHSLATGRGFPAHAPYPPGLPGLYALLAVLGIGRSWAIVGMNTLFLVLAVASSIVLYRRAFGAGRQASVLLGCGVLLSYVLVKAGALALSDVPFTGLTTASLLSLTLATQGGSVRRRLGLLAVGVVLLLAATTIRTAGAALVPAAVISAFETGRGDRPWRAWLRTRAAAGCAVVCALAVAAFGITISSSRYFHDASGAYGTGAIRTTLAGHVRNLGELGVNVPETRLPGSLHPLLVPAGLIVLLVVLAGVWRERRHALPVHAFTLSYLVLVFAWPYTDARFWIPLVPVAFGYAYRVLESLWRYAGGRIAVVLYVAAFAAAGIGALAYDTRLSYSGSAFPDRYGSAVGLTLQPTYRVFFREALPGDAGHVDVKALQVLRDW